MPYYSIDELRRIIAPIASAHGVESVSVFGSYSRGNATANSDVDLKIEKGHLRSLFQLSGFRLAVHHNFLEDDSVTCFDKAAPPLSESFPESQDRKSPM